MPLGISPDVLAIIGGAGFFGLSSAAVHALISNRGRMAATELDADARRAAADTIARAIMAEHGRVFTPLTEFESACSTSSAHIAQMAARQTQMEKMIAALQQQFGEFGRKLNDLEKLVLSGQVQGQDTWVEHGLIGKDVAAAAAERHTPHGGTPVQRTQQPQPAPAGSALAFRTPDGNAAATHVIPRLGPDGLPAASGGAGLFTVDPGTAARQRVAVVIATPEMRELADKFQQARQNMGDALPMDLLWQYMHNLLPDVNVFLWSHCSRRENSTGIWYDALRPTVEKALGVHLATRFEEQFPTYQTSDEYKTYYATLRNRAAS